MGTDCASIPDASLAADYDHELDRLHTYVGFNADGTERDHTDYTYDAFDRVAREDETHPWGTRDTTFTYLGLTGLVTREDQTGTKAATKTYDYDAWGQRVSMTNQEGAGALERYSYGYDVHGSTSLLVNQGGGGTPGSVKATYGYTPYGGEDPDLTTGDRVDNPDDPDPNGVLNPYRYTGRRVDLGSDSIDMGARRFGPDVSHFIQRDFFNGALDDLFLATDPLTQNRYSLAGGNPVSYVEWDGHMVIAEGGSAQPGPNPLYVDRDTRVDNPDRTGGEYDAGIPGFIRNRPDPGKPEQLYAQVDKCLYGYEVEGVSCASDPAASVEAREFFSAACDFLGPCAIQEAVEQGDWLRAGLETAMVLPIGKLGKLGKLFRGSTRATRGTGVLVEGAGRGTRTINFRPSTPNWGLTGAHLEKHLFGSGPTSLRRIDPAGNPDLWRNYIQELAGRPATATLKGGIEDVIGTFPKADGSGTFQFGIRIAPGPNGTWDLVTLLTGQ